MTADPDVDLSADRLFFLGTGIINKIVCAPKAWSGDKVAEEATKADPPGTSVNQWVVSTIEEDDAGPFKTGNPQPCADDPERVHWLLNC